MAVSESLIISFCTVSGFAVRGVWVNPPPKGSGDKTLAHVRYY